MHTANYFRVIDCTNDAAKYHEDLQDRPPKQQEDTYVGLSIHHLTKINIQRWHIAPALRSLLEVHGAIEWWQSKKTLHSTAPADRQINE